MPAVTQISSVPEALHPLRPLSKDELDTAREVVMDSEGGDGISFWFHSIYLNEPKKTDLVEYLVAEHTAHASAKTIATARPPREILVQYDVIQGGKAQLAESVVDVDARELRTTRKFARHCQIAYTASEFALFHDVCVSSQLFKDALDEFEIPDKFKVAIDPWPYGGLELDDNVPRYMQGLCYARDTTSSNNDANHYSYPVPIIPVMDVQTKQLIRVDRLATGGKGDGLYPEPWKPGMPKKKLFGHNVAADYVPELLDEPLRTDLKPINITQPEGASFKVHDDHLVEWSNWRFRIGFTPREGAVLHDVCYDGRPVMFRLSFSEMTVPYGDPRPPFHRKQAFDFGDGGIGRAANNLQLGCDCLGAIHYLDCMSVDSTGKPAPMRNVVCLHEQDNGIGWKHTNFRTERAVVSRMREFVVQFVATLANYEYVFAYKLDTAGGISVEVRATGILSTVAIDQDKTSAYGNVVAPGVLAQNHQHIFAVRMDPSIDSYAAGDTGVIIEETHPMPVHPDTNPYGNGYEIKRKPVERAQWADADPLLNRIVRMENPNVKNPVSGKNVGYKFTPPATQLLLAAEGTVMERRAPFGKHHLWFTGHRDGELWAAGEFTNQSAAEEGGVKAMVARGDWFVEGEEDDHANGTTNGTTTNGTNGHTNGHSNGDTNGHGANGNSESTGKVEATARKSSPVVWSVFGLTHNPRVEDWPVMPVEIHQIHIKPADFFTKNPALTIPSTVNQSSVLVPTSGAGENGEKNGTVAEKSSSCCQNGGSSSQQDGTSDPVAHLQGTGPDVDPKELPVETTG